MRVEEALVTLVAIFLASLTQTTRRNVSMSQVENIKGWSRICCSCCNCNCCCCWCWCCCCIQVALSHFFLTHKVPLFGLFFQPNLPPPSTRHLLPSNRLQSACVRSPIVVSLGCQFVFLRHFRTPSSRVTLGLKRAQGWWPAGASSTRDGQGKVQERVTVDGLQGNVSVFTVVKTKWTSQCALCT